MFPNSLPVPLADESDDSLRPLQLDRPISATRDILASPSKALLPFHPDPLEFVQWPLSKCASR